MIDKETGEKTIITNTVHPHCNIEFNFDVDYIDKKFFRYIYEKTNVIRGKCGTCKRTYMSNIPLPIVDGLYKCNSCMEGCSEDQLKEILK